MNADLPLELSAIAPFDLAMTVEALRRRPSNRAEAWVAGEYRRVLALDGAERLIGVRQTGPTSVQVRRLDGKLDAVAGAEAARVIARTLGLDVDLAPIHARAAGDERLAPLVRQLAGLKPPRFPTLWVTFANVVPYQQVSLDAGVAVMNRVIEALGTRHPYEGATYYGFPTPERFLAAETAALRACGLSEAKVRTLKHIASAILAGALREEELAALDDAAAIERLRALPGIGPWSAQLVLLRGFRRLSVFPGGDSGAQKNLRLLLGELAGGDVRAPERELLELLGPWRGYLYFLLLGSSLLRRGTLRATGE